MVKETLATCAAACEGCGRSESTWMCVLIAFHWLCWTQGHSVTQNHCPVQHHQGQRSNGSTAPQEHSIHLQAGVGCNPTVTPQNIAVSSLSSMSFWKGKKRHTRCPTVWASSQTHTTDRLGTNCPKSATG